MGKKSKAKASKRSSAKKRATKGDIAEVGSEVQTLVSHAEIALSHMQIENALGYYEQALSIDSLNCDIMDSLADIYLNLGESNRALELLLKSTQVSPGVNPAKYLYVAQLQHGGESLSSYEQALHFLSLSREETQELSTMVVDKQLIKSYCGIAELYLTDLCYDENAEQLCEEAIAKALAIDPNSIDANHALANLRLSQNRPFDASVLVEGVYKRIHDIRERINARTIVEDLHAPAHEDFSEHVNEPDIPSLEICVSTVKLMLECAASKPRLAEDALVFAAELLNDNDENVEVWYIAGVAAMTTVPPDLSVALHYFEQAKSMIDSFREFPDFEDGAMDEHYSLISDHVAMIHSQQQGQNHLTDCPAQKARDNALQMEEWSSDEEEGGADRMDI